MKATGMVRKIDELGRVVIPMELRRTLGIAEKDPLEVYTTGNSIVLKKYEPGCEFCGDLDIKLILHDKKVCGKCAANVVEKAGA
ncbi:AbrB/MazE/SpoVT family DNA-binding domain-containing protein [Chengkuizengella axinellae]|uniref:AbrB/MazE/SpoVT family DNA-binding domain-containing protein n=1 Tax=Chengkuizengella axinellae TaxID=3064388 RepID=A0ABT9J6K2_9BACL|nr:AbrB/MazE/SpoVT family DNA-binding domain-containing protein [Chengkuizengella sp. 2205SS18-9]MDP5277251.1 AbrB/MazE/SpoVT family DNA-binding domain-containing protein [Chengkuizengella sp. 2205SS18-9]